MDDEAANLRRAVTRLNRRMRAERPAGAPGATQLTVLGHLHAHGPSTPSAVAAAESQHLQSLTRVLRALEQQRLITRTTHPDDRRAALLALTAKGRRAVERDMAARDAWLATALADLDVADRRLLTRAAAIMERVATT